MLITIWIRTKRTNYFKIVRTEKKSGNVPTIFCTQNKRQRSVDVFLKTTRVSILYNT